MYELNTANKQMVYWAAGKKREIIASSLARQPTNKINEAAQSVFVSPWSLLQLIVDDDEVAILINLEIQ